MSVSAAGALGSGLVSVTATKILALGLGPAGMAVLGTLEQIRDTAVVGGTLNGRTALVQGASSLEGIARREYVRTGAVLFAGATAFAAAVLALAPVAVARWAGLPAPQAGMLRWLAETVALVSLFVFLSASLTAAGAIGRLAWLQSAGPAAMAVLAWPVSRFAGVRGLPLLLTLAAGSSAAAACAMVWAERATLRQWWLGAGRWFRRRAAGHFFSIAGVMLAAGFAGTGALVMVRAGILHGQGLAAAGQFDAAWGLSMNQVTLVLASLQAYCLPALARARDPEERGREMARMLTLAAPAAAVSIAVLALAKPWLLELFYSSAFEPAARYLRWTLLGDYLKVTSWILSISMLAAADMRIFLATDLAVAGVFVAAARTLTRWWTPAESAAMAFVLMNAAHLGICGMYVYRRHGFRWQGRCAAAWTAGAALVAAATVVSWRTS
jgi:PST family polysaccharide transporter